MDKAVLYEQMAQDALVSRYVEKYQFYRIDKPCFLKTIPNGRMECWFIFEGGFDIWNDTSNRFEPSKQIGAYPSTLNSLLFRIEEKLFCLNIKLRLSAISIKAFKHIYPAVIPSNVGRISFFKELSPITIKDFFDGHGLNVNRLDDWLKPLFQQEQDKAFIQDLTQLITAEHVQKVGDLCQKLGISQKTLNRRTQQYFHLSPKELLRIFRFEKTSAYFKNSFANQLTDALEFGYHDQSHFANESRRITGYSPRELYSRMTLSTHDLMVFDLNSIN